MDGITKEETHTHLQTPGISCRHLPLLPLEDQRVGYDHAGDRHTEKQNTI